MPSFRDFPSLKSLCCNFCLHDIELRLVFTTGSRSEAISGHRFRSLALRMQLSCTAHTAFAATASDWLSQTAPAIVRCFSPDPCSDTCDALNAERIAQLREQAAAGANRTKLAKEFGISRETLYQYIRLQ